LASCSKIDHSLQAYLDGELTQSERIILRRHLDTCSECAALLQKHQHVSAEMFESFIPYRLDRDLSSYIVEHLPELDNPMNDMAGLNKRAKHPAVIRDRFKRLAPIAVASLLLVLGYLINQNWPTDDMSHEFSVGMVTGIEGKVNYITEDAAASAQSSVQDIVQLGDTFVTTDRAFLMLSLLGNTHIKMDQHSRITVLDERRISIKEGRAYLDVGKDNRLFKVLTPTGDITVFGTKFTVEVTSESTRVVVQEGLVEVEKDQVFRELSAGQAVTVSDNESFPDIYTVDIANSINLADFIEPDEKARIAFLDQLQTNYISLKVTGVEGFMLQGINNNFIDYIELGWEPSIRQINDKASYLVYVYSETNEPIFKATIKGTDLGNPSINKITLKNRSLKNTQTKWAWVKLIPDTFTGDIETQFTKCEAVLTNN